RFEALAKQRIDGVRTRLIAVESFGSVGFVTIACLAERGNEPRHYAPPILADQAKSTKFVGCSHERIAEQAFDAGDFQPEVTAQYRIGGGVVEKPELLFQRISISLGLLACRLKS